MFKTKNAVAIITIIAVLSLVFGSTVIFADTSEDEDIVLEASGGTDTVSFRININNSGTVFAKTETGEEIYIITENGTYTFAMGAVIILEAVPAAGYRFEKWTGKAASGNTSVITLDLGTIEEKNMTAVAHFRADTSEPEPEVIKYTLTTGVEGEGAISPSTQEYEEGVEVDITATPADGWHFKGWKEGEGYSSPVDGSITMDDDKHVVAIFEKDTEPSSPPSRPNRPSTPSTPSSNPPEQDEIIDIPVEEIPEGSVDINAGIPSQDEEITTVDDETVPEADALPDSLPQTGGIPAGGFYGLGSILAAAGLFLRKKYR